MSVVITKYIIHFHSYDNDFMWLFLVTCHKLMLYYRYYSQNATNSCQPNKNNTKILFVGFKGNVGNLTEIIYTFNKNADIM